MSIQFSEEDLIEKIVRNGIERGKSNNWILEQLEIKLGRFDREVADRKIEEWRDFYSKVEQA